MGTVWDLYLAFRMMTIINEPLESGIEISVKTDRKHTYKFCIKYCL
jgi:hypothetical protein